MCPWNLHAWVEMTALANQGYNFEPSEFNLDPTYNLLNNSQTKITSVPFANSKDVIRHNSTIFDTPENQLFCAKKQLLHISKEFLEIQESFSYFFRSP